MSRLDTARFVIELALKASVILGTAGIASWLLRRASAATRHLIWSAALVVVLALPVCSLLLPRWEVPIVSIAAAPDIAAEPPATPAPAAGPTSMAVSSPHETSIMRHAQVMEHAPLAPARVSIDAHAAASTPPTAARGIDWTVVALSVWIAGALLTALRLTVGVLALWFVEARTPRVLSRQWLELTADLSRRLQLTRPVRLLQSRRAAMPLSWGWIHPVVLLPADAGTWTIERRRIVLLHELAHVKRRDCLTQMLAQIVCAAHWFNPLAWFAASRLRAERERACDDLVLGAGTPNADYADHLLDIARAFRAAGFPSWATVAMAKPSQLEGRLLAILDPARPRHRWPRGVCAAAVLAIAGVAFPLAALQPWVRVEAAQVHPAALGDQTAQTTVSKTDKRIEGVAGGGPQGGVPGGVRGGVAGGVASGVSGGASDGVSSGVAGGVRSGVAGGVDGGVADGIAGVAPGISARPTIADADPDDDQDVVQPKTESDRRVIDALVTALKDENKDVRQQAASALGHIADPRAIDGLTVALRDPSPDVREQAAGALAHHKSSAAVGALLLALKDTSPAVRRQATAAIAHARDERHVDALAMMLRDSDAEVREHAAMGLGQLRVASAIEPLSQLLKDASAEVRQQAAFALGQIRDPRTVPALVAALGDSDADVRHQAVFALGQLRAAAAVEPIMGALKDKDADVRQQAAFALGQIRDPKAVDALGAVLTDANADVRQQAVFALGQLRAASAVPALITALGDKDKDVREQVAYALGQIRDPRAVDPLTAALRDPVASVRERAAFALGQLARVAGKNR